MKYTKIENMTLEIVIPEADAKGRTTKDLVFSILVEDKPKTLTQLHKQIKKQYEVSVTFQAVIKAVKSLMENNVLVKQEKLYSVNKDWIFETRNFFDRLYSEHFKVKRPAKRIELGKEVTVYTVHNLLELDQLWNDLLTNWTKKETKDKRNVWKGRHAWWLIPRLQEEDMLHDAMLKGGIRTYNLWTSSTSLDKAAAKYYHGKYELSKIAVKQNPKRDIHIAAFGNNFIKFEIPISLSRELEKTYRETKRLEDLDIKRAMDIFKKNVEIEFMTIKDEFLAGKIKEEIASFF
jgi:hypothetical protein